MIIIIVLKVNGIVEVSSLACFRHFDIIKNVAVDAMHCIYGGVTKILLGLWFDSVHHKQPWYCGRRKKVVSDRLLSMHPPSNITKAPRSLDERKYWKCKQFLMNQLAGNTIMHVISYYNYKQLQSSCTGWYYTCFLA